MDKVIIIDTVKKYWTYIALIILCFILFHKCESEVIKTTENKTLKEQNKQLQSKRANIEKTVEKLQNVIVEKQKEIIYRNKIVYVKLDSIKDFNTKGIANYYKDRYNVTDEVKNTNLGVALADTVAILNISELIRYDGVKAELKIANDIIVNTNEIVTKKDSIILVVDTQNQNLINMEKNTQSLYKKEKRKATFYQVGLALVTILTAFEFIQK